MDFTTSQYVQLIAGLAGATGLFVLVYRMRESTTLAFLLILMPFQLVDSRYGTLNTLLIYIVAVAYVLQGRLRAAPLFWPSLLLLFAYAISFSMSQPSSRVYHVIYLVGFFSNFLLFYLVYNFVQRTGDWQFPIKVLFVTNALVIVAFLLEMIAGQAQVSIFGIQEWTVSANRARAGRIVGPWGSTHTTSDYLVAQCVLAGFWLMHEDRKRFRRWLVALLFLNLMCLVSTGDRGGFAGLVAATLLFLFAFRRELGVARSVRLLIAGMTLFAVGSLIIVQYTDFGVLFERLERTEIDETDMLDNRSRAFARGMTYFEESPIVGNGPNLQIGTRESSIGDIPLRLYPHNLPLHILASVGIVGFAAWALFFVALVRGFMPSFRSSIDSHALAQMPRIGVLLIFLFLFGEMRIEFLRFGSFDYQNYRFALFGALLACAHMVKQEGRAHRAPTPVVRWREPALTSYNRGEPAHRPQPAE